MTRSREWVRLASLFLGLGLTPAALAETPEQPSQSEREVEDEIIVIAPRVEKQLHRFPGAVSVVDAESIRRAQLQLTLAESLSPIPGLFIQNRTNFAQDTRIAIRGFGARSSFGIRGIKIVADGIPLTLPDGQGQVDTLDFASAERIEVMRGPSASLYGSASGGVILVTTEEGPEVPFAGGRIAMGGLGYRSYQGKAGGRAGPFNYLVSLSRQELDGYRDHSRMENVLLNSKFSYAIDESSQLRLLVSHLHAPRADDPGSLTAAAVEVDRRQANPRNVLYDAGEAIDHTTLGLVYEKTFNEHHHSSLANFYGWRDFDNRLPFTTSGAVHYDRFFLGGNAKHVYRDQWLSRENRLTAGIDVTAQLDDRTRRDNDLGQPGATRLAQEEDVTDLGLFLQDEFEIVEDLGLTASARYDWVRFRITDHFPTDGDDSGLMDFHEPSFMAGLMWNPYRSLNPYLRISNAFETPTTTELSNPAGGGFDANLEPQRALNFELGVKGWLIERLRYEIVGFHIRIENELIPYEIAGMPGRTFYRNAGRSTRWGLELGLHGEPLDDLTFTFSYTLSHFVFDEYRTVDENGNVTATYDGNRTPGIPDHHAFFGLQYEHPVGFFARFDLEYVGPFFADDANLVRTDDYVVSDLRVGFARRSGGWELEPYVGLNNLFGAKYSDNVRLNAFGGRYFEPAPTFNAYGGVSVTYHFGTE